MEFQQSPLNAAYLEALHWNVFRLDGVQMFYKRIPFMGGFLKIQRPLTLPPITKLLPLLTKHKVKTVAIEPTHDQTLVEYKAWCTQLSKHVRVVRSSYLGTKTILVDLSPKEEDIFQHFSEAKRRAVRKAQKNNVTVVESQNINDLINVKSKSGGFLGFIPTIGIDKLWPIVTPKHATVVLAYSKKQTIIGGILLLFWEKTAYYWIAGATGEGKKLSAPTLLVWEALKISKKRGCTTFDFIGVWDERKPKDHHDWLGFTKFKEGFGGTPLYYPVF